MPHVNVVEVVLGVVDPVFFKVLCREEDVVPDIGGLDGGDVAAADLRFAVSLSHYDFVSPLISVGVERTLVSVLT